MTSLRLALILAVLPLSSFAESSLSLAEQVVEASGTREAMHEGFRLTMKPALDTMKSQGAPEAMLAELREASEELFREHFQWPEVRSALARLYAERFSEGELTDLLQFYRSSTGKKASSLVPLLTQQGSLAATQRLQQAMPHFQKRVEAIMSKHQAAIPAQPDTGTTASPSR